MYANTKIKESVEVSCLTAESEVFDLMLFNDDVNTFDWVIETLMDVCGHEEMQAEQCAFIVHYKGKCVVKSGDLVTLLPLQQQMTKRMLSVQII